MLYVAYFFKAVFVKFVVFSLELVGKPLLIYTKGFAFRGAIVEPPRGKQVPAAEIHGL
jgi:hypothetical protein